MWKRTRESVLADIKAHPENHKHVDMAALDRCCFVGGALHISLIDAHGRYAPQGRNGGQTCDVRQGPCSCGAWH